MTYYARFEIREGSLFRFDTRIYLGNGEPNEKSYCVGAVVGINPGSARYRVLNEYQQLELGKDKMLPFVRNRFIAAYRKACRQPPHGAYVQILNVFYLCNEHLSQAITQLEQFSNPPMCPGEQSTFPITWYAWGAESAQLAALKQRFMKRHDLQSSFMNRDRQTFGTGVPNQMEFAKHPRGMPALPIEEKLASLLQVADTAP